MISLPLVSVLMPVYNGAQYIGAAIESVMNQSYSHFELIIIDDGSTDSTREVITRYQDTRISLTVQDRNHGLVYTRNNGLSKARGDYISMLDADDIALPARLMEQISFLESHTDYSMVGSRLRVIDQTGKLTGENWDYSFPVESINSRMLFHNCFAQSAVCIRRSLLSGCVYRPEYPSAEDYDLWVRIAKTGKVWNLPQYLLLHRRYSQSTSAVHSTVVEDAVCRIVTEQLLELGIVPNKCELSLHRSVGEKISSEWSSERLLNLEIWLQKLYQANQNKKLYPVAAFNDVIVDRWFCACREASLNGINISGIYFRSPLQRIGSRALLRDSILFTRSLVIGIVKKIRAKLRRYE